MSPAPNPFYVLELPPDCTRAEIERAGQKLMAMLELGLRDSAHYTTPFGPAQRDTTTVREAMAELRDPQRRLFHELWAIARPWDAPGDLVESPMLSSRTDTDTDTTDAGRGFARAHTVLGWRS